MVDIKAVLTGSDNNWSPDTKIRFPDDEEFAQVTARWATYKPPTYTAAISPATEEDVVKAVRFGRRDRPPPTKRRPHSQPSPPSSPKHFSF
jgi:hypothetical protein